MLTMVVFDMTWKDKLRCLEDIASYRLISIIQVCCIASFMAKYSYTRQYAQQYTQDAILVSRVQ